MPNSPQTEPFLLDTHVWIWLMNGDQRLKSSKALRMIERTGQTSRLYVSVISVWEVGMLEAKRRISLPFSCLEWVQRALRAPGIALAPLTPEIAVDSSQLADFLGDPADRILVATAKRLRAALVTSDQQLLEYAKKTHQVETITV